MYPYFVQYLRLLVHVIRWKIPLVLLLMLGLSSVEGIGVLMLVPLLAWVGVLETAESSNPILSSVAKGFETLGIAPTLTNILLIYIVVVSVHELLIHMQKLLIAGIQQEFTFYLRNQMFETLSYTQWSVFLKTRSSDLTQLLTLELQNIGFGTGQIFYLATTAMLTVVYWVLAWQVSPTLTLVTIASGGLLFFGLRRHIRAAAQKGKAVTENMKSIFAFITEQLNGMKLAKSYGAETHHIERFAQITEEYKYLTLGFQRDQSSLRLGMTLGMVLLLSGFVYLAVEVLHLAPASLLLLCFLLARLLPKILSIQRNSQQVAHVLPAFRAAMTMQEHLSSSQEESIKGSTTISEFTGHLEQGIVLNQVDFAYGGSGSPKVLQGFDLSISPCQTTAIVGASGAGKSTVADLLMGLIFPTSGAVEIGGVPLTSKNASSWRQHLGYVPQEAFLFHESIRQNLLWVQPKATEEELWQTLDYAAAAQFIRQLPQGLDTVVGDRGVRLSGGERQRVALARAILRRPALLLLDEATSALDTENEQQIQNALEQLHGQMTIVMIAHRLSTIRQADQIVVMDQGRVVESGSWEILYAKEQGVFRGMVDQSLASTRTDSSTSPKP